MASVSQLGYLGFEVSDLAAWEVFAREVLGVGVAPWGDDGALALRIDGRAYRMLVHQGPADDLAFVGWEVADRATLDHLAEGLRAAGVAVAEGSAAQRTARQVEHLVTFSDPGGVPCELYCGPALAATPFSSELCRSGFVGDAMGAGHLVVSARSKAESLGFYTELLGLRLSDHITCEYYGFQVDLAFLHANARHHSIAFGDRQEKRIHHFMLEVGSMDDVGLAYDRALAHGVRIVNTLGRHPNDRMFSFYAKTPSGFQFELGWGGREVDDATWEPTTYDRISEWGHHPPEALAPRRPRQERS
jgi:2,3-dihydroxybiphenyl 1,2-dioxygenase